MDKITVGVLTISDRCSKNETTDESGPGLISMLEKGAVKNCKVVKAGLVPDVKEDIEAALMEWCEQGINLILTTGGTGISERDVTPEATAAVLEKTVLGISQLMFKKSSEVTPLAALSRGVAGVRKKSLIINLPGSRKASGECLEAVAEVIPHAVDLIIGSKKDVERVHASLEKKSTVALSNSSNRSRISPYSCISVSEAQQIILDRTELMKREIILGFEQALYHVLAQDLTPKYDLPPFDVSLKDGYAVRSSYPHYRRILVGISKPGEGPNAALTSDESCVTISTGAPIPLGADAVVPVELTEEWPIEGKKGSGIRLKSLPQKGENIRPKGSDFKRGQMLMPFGTYLDVPAVGLLAAAGINSVRVFKKPVVAVFSTGDELVDPKEPITQGKVLDSNRITLTSLLKEENFRAVDIGIVKDEPDALRSALEKGFRTADVVVTTGSMSMGEKDYLKDVLVSDFDSEILFGRVWMKPGKPTSFALVNFEEKPKFFFGLPGNPASAFVTAHLFLLPALRKISGQQKVMPATVSAAVKVKNTSFEERPQYVRGILTADKASHGFSASVTGDQSSSRIGSCVNSNGLIVFPEKTRLTKNQLVQSGGAGGGETFTVTLEALLIGRCYN